MPRTGKKITCTQEQRIELEKLSHSQKAESRLLRRARIVLGLLDGKQRQDVAKELGVENNTVTKWRDRFDAQALQHCRRTLRLEKTFCKWLANS